MVAWTMRSIPLGRVAGQDAAPQRQGGEWLVRVDRAVDGRQRRPGLDQVGGDAQRSRRRVRMREGVGVLHDAGGEHGGDIEVDGRRRGRGMSSAIISQVAAASASTHASPASVSVVRDVMVDVHDPRRGEPVGALAGHAPVRDSGPSTTTARSGSSCGRRAHLRRRREGPSRLGGTGSAATTSACLPSRSAAMRSASADPSVSASGFSWQMAVMRSAPEDRGRARRTHDSSVRSSSSSRSSRSTRSPASIESSCLMTQLRDVADRQPTRRAAGASRGPRR